MAKRDSIFFTIIQAIEDEKQIEKALSCVKKLYSSANVKIMLDLQYGFYETGRVKSDANVGEALEKALNYLGLESAGLEILDYLENNNQASFLAKKIHVISKRYSAEEIKYLDSIKSDAMPDSLLHLTKKEAAIFMLQLLQKYKASHLDFFGYDISHRRDELIKYVAAEIESKKELRVYKLQIDELQHSTHLKRDMLLGVFINQMIEDAQYPNSTLNKLDDSLIKIASASVKAYEIRKNKKIVQSAINIAQSALYNMVEKQYLMLLNSAGSDQLPLYMTAIYEEWEKNTYSRVKFLKNRQQQKVLKNAINRMLTDIFEYCANESHLHDLKVGAFHKIIQDEENLGALIGMIVYKKASLEYVYNIHHLKYKNEFDIFKVHVQYLNRLPKHLREIHNQYVEHKKVQIHARRILKTLENYRVINITNPHFQYDLFQKILYLCQEQSMQAHFIPYIKDFLDPVLGPDMQVHYKWNDTPKNIVKTKAFGEFIRYIIETAAIVNRKPRLHRHLQRSINTAVDMS